MDTAPQSKRSTLLWLLLLIAVVFLWWYLRPEPDRGASHAAIEADRIAALDTDPDDILVDLRDDTSAATVAQIERDLGIDLVLVSAQSRDEQFYRAKVDPARRDAILAALQRRSDVEVAEPDAMFAASPIHGHEVLPPEGTWEGFPNDPMYSRQWHMRQIGMPEAWKLADGEGVIVAVLDTGVAYEDHGRFHQVEDLKGLTFVKPYDFVDDDTHANDDHGHGTHVTGTIAQVTNNKLGVTGVARNVQIMPLKVLGGNGSGSVAGIADAIRYAADNGARVINMSLGGPFPSKALKNAVAYAHKKGVVVICAAGNDGRNKVGYPAAYPGAVAVASTQEDEGTAFYSNYGKDIDIAAPGGNTRSGEAGGVLQNTIKIGDPTKSGYFAFMGTSMAAPHAAGVAALVVGEGVTNPAMVEQILKESARRPNGKTYSSDRYGAGIIDAPAAVHAEAQRRKDRRGMGTTVVACVIDGRRATVAHVGDSRAYLLRDGHLHRLTTDHTIVAELVARGAIAPDEADRHAYKNVLSRNLGAKPTAAVDVSEVELQPGDRLMLCSDGLYGYAPADAVHHLVASTDPPDEVVRDLIEAALRGGGGDNVTAIVIEAGVAVVPRATMVLRTTGAGAWWSRRDRFLAAAHSGGVHKSPLCALLGADEAISLVAGNFADAVYHDLEKATGVNVWTYAENLARGWLGQGGAWPPLRDLLDGLARAADQVLGELRREDMGLADLVALAVARAMVTAETAVGGVLAERLRSLETD
ncbi:MAG: S8 family serine peptidase, partial [Kofleriaceae bacterium]